MRSDLVWQLTASTVTPVQWLSSHRNSSDDGIARSGFEVAAHHVDRGTFACTIGAEQPKDFPSPDGERDALHRFNLVKVFDEVEYLHIGRKPVFRQMDGSAFGRIRC